MKFNPLYDEQRIQLEIFSARHSGKLLMVPNVSWSWFYWEVDLIAITKARYVHEYEIKVTHADFKSDFKKKKHFSINDAYKKRIHENRLRRMPNYFWYVAPLLAFPMCVPDYAGLIEVVPNNYGLALHEIKKPKLLHRNKISKKGIKAITRSLMFKYWNVARERDNWKIQKDLYSKRD